MLIVNLEVGSGKSSLTSLVVDDLLKESVPYSGRLLAFFFCDKTSRSDELVGPRSIIRFLLMQLVQSTKEELPAELVEAYESERRNGIINRKAHIFMQQIIFSAQETIIVVDGLDECDLETRTLLLDDLSWLLRWTRSKLKVFIASRPDSDIVQFFEEKYPGARIFMQNDRDIQTYVKMRVEEDFRLKRLSPSLKPIKEAMIDILISRSEGMFRWVQLSLKSLRTKGRPETALDKLQRLPLKLKELYEEIYLEIQDIDQADFLLVRRTLLLIMYQRIPLASTEVVEAVCNEVAKDSSLLGNRTQLLLDLCSDFLEVSSDFSVLRLAHSSVRDFLESREDYAEDAGHLEMAKLCLLTVSEWFRTATSDCNSKSWEFGHFICYALTQWPAHLWKTLKLGSTDKELTLLLDPESGKFSPRQPWREWLSQVLAIAPSTPGDAASRFSASDEESVASKGYELCGSPESMSADSSASDCASDSCIWSSSDELKGGTQLLRKASPLSGSKKILFPVKHLKWTLRQLIQRLTSVPANPLFAFSVWHIPELCYGHEPSPDLESPWNKLNINRETPIMDFCTSFRASELEELLNAEFAKYFKHVLGQYSEFISAVITRNFKGAQKTELVRLLLGHGAKFDRGSTGQPNALHSAADFNLPDVMTLLLSDGAEIDATDYSGATALDRACANGSVEAAHLLLTAGASTKSEQNDRTSSLLVAASHHQWGVVRLLAEERADLDMAEKDWSGRTALELAIKDLEDQTVIHLLQKGADGSASGSDGRPLIWWPLRCGSDHRSFAIVEALLRHERAVLHTAVAYYGTPLGFATKNLDESTIKLLCSFGADPNTKDLSGNTALHIAVNINNLAKVKLLVDANGDIEARDSNGSTALHIAAANVLGRRADEVVKWLCTHGANPNAQDCEGKTPLHRAVASKASLSIVQALIDANIDISIPDNNGQTALSQIQCSNNAEVFDLPWAHDADLKVKDSLGRSILHMAAEDGDPEGVSAFWKAGLDVSAKDSNGQTALHLAARRTPQYSYFTKYSVDALLSVVDELLHHGADLNAIDNDGNTPVFLAMEASRGFAWSWAGDPMVEYLLGKGAVTSITNFKGESASTHPRTQPKSIHEIHNMTYRFNPPDSSSPLGTCCADGLPELPFRISRSACFWNQVGCASLNAIVDDRWSEA